ncbi:hypothetical protein BDZ94DRAFT_1307162 [Collybia nuda]|uniref:DUF6533 domain-containing protein n=1 Tax=Collybia nuda TaxID=64659 RepID=A0A9P6CM21_9AGAR|nr:hypothetical protein BDZ94DRAFT_1307162 [Collybia nuda]
MLSLENIPLELDDFQTSTYMHISSATLLITDWFFTLELEATYAWNPPWNMGTVLFFLTRYLVIADTSISLHRQLTPSLSIDACNFLYMAEGWLISFGIIIAELILTIRVWVIWERTRNIKIFLIVVSIVTASAGMMGYIFYGTKFFMPNTAIGSVCFDKAGAVLQWAYGALLAHQTIISTMTVMKGIQHYRLGSHNTSLIYTFYEDGVSYYAVMIALSAVNIFMLHKENILLIPIQRVLQSLLTARMLLNLRKEAGALYVNRRNSKAEPVSNLSQPTSANTTSSWKRVGVNPKNRRSRVEGWFGKEESLVHQQSTRSYLEV